MYYGVKGGIFTIQTGGTYKVYGPESSIIGDNNQLALALLMALPLIEYLRSTTESRILRWILAGCLAATAISVLGSYSRGAYVAMVAIAIFFLFQVRRPFLYLIAGAAVIIPALYFMPQDFWDRVNTIGSAETDSSFHGRWVAWQVAFRYAVDHFPFGAGFYGPQLHAIFNSYFPAEEAHAAHSIYFQVLGEHGFIGLFLYLAIVIWSFKLCWSIVRKTKYAPDSWSHKLARMIQISLLGFYIGGAALSMAYYDLFVVLVFLLPLIATVAPKTAKEARHKWRAPNTGDSLPAEEAPLPALSRGGTG
jgi:probable O-glycosylation ligase (exosortase A-associated)